MIPRICEDCVGILKHVKEFINSRRKCDLFFGGGGGGYLFIILLRGRRLNLAPEEWVQIPLTCVDLVRPPRTCEELVPTPRT